ncbi:MAG: 4-hydroxybenzoate octaprenyltransferase, partial [Nitrospiraceae bacterium]
MPDPSPTDHPSAGFIQPACSLGTCATVSRLIRLSNQSGTFLLMLPTLWALVLASRGRPPVGLLIIFATGSFLMRSAGVIMNDLADRSFDRHVARTRARPLASGAIGVSAALTIVMILLVLSAGLLTFLNRFTILLSPVAVVLAAVYPFSKRILSIPQAVLGMAFGWGVIMAWAAVQDGLSPQAWLLYAATICWAVAYDSIYALQDRGDDIRVGVKSSAVLFGSRTWLAVGLALTIMFILLGWAGWLTGANGGFYGVLIAIAGFLSQQVWRLKDPISPALAFRLFQQHVWVGWAILAG